MDNTRTNTLAWLMALSSPYVSPVFFLSPARPRSDPEKMNTLPLELPQVLAERSFRVGNYDPWGLALPLNADAEKVGGSPVDRFTYNGKEKQQGLGWFDYGARIYDPQTGRWGAVDPLAESMNSWSPFNYTFNNPLKYVDRDGTVPEITIQGANHSSVTVKTDLVDLKVNASSLGIDFGGNYTFWAEKFFKLLLILGA